jgi:hypothetical protein
MWPIANFIKGLTIDEAIKQLKFLNKKGALIAIEVTNLDIIGRFKAKDYGTQYYFLS